MPPADDALTRFAAQLASRPALMAGLMRVAPYVLRHPTDPRQLVLVGASPDADGPAAAHVRWVLGLALFRAGLVPQPRRRVTAGRLWLVPVGIDDLDVVEAMLVAGATLKVAALGLVGGAATPDL